jgi:serine protease Do
MAENLKLKDRRGAIVGQVFPGDPADKAGIKTGDIILEIDGRKIENTNELLRIVAALPVGKKVEIIVLRNGRELRQQLVVGERKDAREITGDSQTNEQLGLTVQEISPEMTRILKLKEKGGVVVTAVKPDSPAEDAGLKVNDVILQVNRVRVESLKDFTDELARTAREETVMFLIKRDDAALFVTLRRDNKK